MLAADADPAIVQELAGQLARVVEAATRAECQASGAAEFERAIVAIGTDIEASSLTTGALVDLEIPSIPGQGGHRRPRQDPGACRRPPRGLP